MNSEMFCFRLYHNCIHAFQIQASRLFQNPKHSSPRVFYFRLYHNRNRHTTQITISNLMNPSTDFSADLNYRLHSK